MARREGRYKYFFADETARVGTDEVSQREGEREARAAAMQAYRRLKSIDLDYEIIREKARRGVNMTLGAK